MSPNPPIGSGDKSADKADFYSRYSVVTLKIWSRSPKSKHFFPMSQWCFCVSSVKIHQLVEEIECRQGSFLQSL